MKMTKKEKKELESNRGLTPRIAAVISKTGIVALASNDACDTEVWHFCHMIEVLNSIGAVQYDENSLLGELFDAFHKFKVETFNRRYYNQGRQPPLWHFEKMQ